MLWYNKTVMSTTSGRFTRFILPALIGIYYSGIIVFGYLKVQGEDPPAGGAHLASACAFTRALTLGSSGENVKCLQKFLNREGFVIATRGPGSPGEETSYFGGLTRAAVVRWQLRNNLPGTGYFGVLSRVAYFTSAGEKIAIQQSPAVPADINSRAPHVLSALPTVVRSGDTVTVYGNNFLPTGNTVIAAYGVVEQRIENIASADGQTLQFIFEAPVHKPFNQSALVLAPASVRADLLGQLERQGKTLDNLSEAYQGFRNEAELDAFLKTQGRSLRDFEEPYTVFVKNSNGASAETKVFFKGMRRMEF